jgi:PadR family transcriptional regulator PadR
MMMGGSDLFTGTLDILVLRAVALGPLHGYAIGQWIRRQSDQVLAVEEGALYPALHRLERRGLVASVWGRTETGRRARFYGLTAAGRRALREETARWKSFSAAVHALLDTSEV